MNHAGRTRNARINQANKHLGDLAGALAALEGHPMTKRIDKKDAWQDGRNALEQLTQCFHEANAYNNVLLRD